MTPEIRIEVFPGRKIHGGQLAIHVDGILLNTAQAEEFAQRAGFTGRIDMADQLSGSAERQIEEATRR
jgi:hypothetical protein